MLLKINGVAIPMPTSITVGISDIDGETHRNLAGNIIRDRITVKRKIELEWGILTQSEMQTLLNAVSGVFFNVTYIDPQQGTTTKNMYVGDRTAPICTIIDNKVMWSGLKMNFIER